MSLVKMALTCAALAATTLSGCSTVSQFASDGNNSFRGTECIQPLDCNDR